MSSAAYPLAGLYDSADLAAAEKHGFKFALLDERAQYHNDWPWYKDAAVEALTRYKDSPAYLKIAGKPVYYLYQVASNPTLTPAKFSELKQHVESKVGPVYWIVDKIAHDHAAGADHDRITAFTAWVWALPQHNDQFDQFDP